MHILSLWPGFSSSYLCRATDGLKKQFNGIVKEGLQTLTLLSF